MEISLKEVLFAFFGGLGLFLYGISTMSNALQAVAGDRMRSILEQGTKNPVRGVLTGALVTALIQSSSATTVLTVGLVNAKLLTLRQAIGVIMGANIGTTFTAYLIGFDLKSYALPILAIGALIFLFSKSKRKQQVGQALFGFGALFFGLTIMGDGMEPLKDLPVFTNLMLSIENNPILGVLIGIIFTMIVQSSSATIGVLQELAYQGAVTYYQAVPILFGDNIGTTITALLASIGASVAARRAAFTHLLFNVAGTLIFLSLFLIGIFPKLVVLVTDYFFALLPGFTGTWETLNIKLQIAQTHAVFNISNTLIHLPLVAVLAYIVTRLIPDKEDTTEDIYRAQFLDKRFLNNPDVAIAQATRETLRMGQLASEVFENCIEYFKTKDKNLYEKSIKLEDTIDTLETEITDYLVLASEKSLSQDASNRTYIILQSINDLERIGDHCENILELTDNAIKYDVTFSEEAQKEFQSLSELVHENIKLAMEALEKNSVSLAKQVAQNEKTVDKMQAEFRKSHIRRLNERKCNGSNGAIYLDLLSNLERISDHCRNIAGYVLDEL